MENPIRFEDVHPEAAQFLYTTYAGGHVIRGRVHIELGRNDLCKCESGKKYKKCCFAKDQHRGKTDLYFVTKRRLESEKYFREQRLKPKPTPVVEEDYTRQIGSFGRRPTTMMSLTAAILAGSWK